MSSDELGSARLARGCERHPQVDRHIHRMLSQNARCTFRRIYAQSLEEHAKARFMRKRSVLGP